MKLALRHQRMSFRRPLTEALPLNRLRIDGGLRYLLARSRSVARRNILGTIVTQSLFQTDCIRVSGSGHLKWLA